MGSAQCELLRTIWHALFGAPLRFFGGEVAGRFRGPASFADGEASDFRARAPNRRLQKSTNRRPCAGTRGGLYGMHRYGGTGGFLVQSGSTLNRFGRDSDKSHPQPAWARNLDGLGITGSLRSPPFCFWRASTGSLRSPLSSLGGGRTDSLRSPGDGARAGDGGRGRALVSAWRIQQSTPLSICRIVAAGEGCFWGRRPVRR